MFEITINGKSYKMKYTIKAVFLFEQITGKPFAINTLLDNYIFIYCILLMNNQDDPLQWEDFLTAIDNDPELFTKMTKAIETQAV